MRQVRYETTGFNYCQDELYRNVENSDCNCESSETARACINETNAEVTYEFNYNYCGPIYDETEEDSNCNCEYSKWENNTCLSDGMMRQIRYETTDFDYCNDILYQTVNDCSCNCYYSEWQDSVCVADGDMKQTRNECSEYEYCTENLERTVEDNNCNCQYTPWQNEGCLANGMMRQQRDELSGYEYCDADLIKEIENTICGCTSTEISRECIGNGTALVNYSWNYPYCNPESENVYDEGCLICIPKWSCSEYTECNQEGYQLCTSVHDFYECGEPFTEDYSEFTKACDYCGIHGPKITTEDTISVIEGELVKIEFKVTDPDSNSVTYGISSPVGNDKEWQTKEGDAGTYYATITVSDGFCTAEKIVKIIVGETPHQGLIFTRTNYEEFLKPGDMQELYVAVENNGNVKLEDLKITVFIDTLGLWKKSTTFDIKPGGMETKLIRFQIPYYTLPGRHYMRIIISNDNIRKIIYRDFDVI